jgi:pimeloyl-ACP methyl ester carboxylesterase
MHHLKLKRVAIVGSSHGGEISINFTLEHPEMVEQLVLVGAVVGGMPYTKHFLERGKALGKPLEKGDIQGAIAAATKDKYLIAPGNEAAKKQMAEILSANPQDLTHPELELPVKAALPRLGEIHIPTLLLVGDADIPDVHAQAGAIEAGIPRARRVVISDVGHLMYLERPAEFSRIVMEFLKTSEAIYHHLGIIEGQRSRLTWQTGNRDLECQGLYRKIDTVEVWGSSPHVPTIYF